MKISASAPAKTILFGEHAVVYGEPAIAIPLPKTRTYAELEPNGQEFRIISDKTGLNCNFQDLPEESGLKYLLNLLTNELGLAELPKDTLTIRSEIPIASGLGSGAALSAAVIRAFFLRFGQKIDNVKINSLAYEIEKIYHGTPSGIDNTVITFEQPILFIKGKGFDTLDANTSHLHILTIDSGISSKTVDVVSDVRANFEKNEPAIREIGSLVRKASSVLKSGDVREIGRLMNENQRLLRKIDVSCPEIDELVNLAIAKGAPGAKLTGAGRGGNILVLAAGEDQAADLKELYEKQGLNVII